MAIMTINTNPSRRILRQFAGAWLVFVGLAGAVVLHKTGLAAVAAAVWTGGGAIGLAGLLAPRAIRPVYLGLSFATFPIGLAISWLVLLAVFALVLTPIAAIMRLLGRDPMTRRFDGAAGTYWTRRPPSDKTERYFRQF